MTRIGDSHLLVDVEFERDGFSLQVRLEAEREVLILFGPSGAGKSTILQAIAGLLTPSAGEITLNGATLFRRGRRGAAANLPSRARHVGYVFQDYALFPHLTALGNVAYPLWRQPGAESRARDLLQRMGLAGLAHRYPQELSGGQQQRVAIARTLATDPRVLLLDEPFIALDLDTRRQVRGEIRKVLHETGVPVVLVTHDREEAIALGDKVAVIDEGLVVAHGEPMSVLGRPPRERVARLTGVENFLRLKVLDVNRSDGVVRCGDGQFLLNIPLSDARVGERVTVGLRADDVLLASARPEGLSARNCIPGRVVSVEVQGPAYLVTVDCGQTVRSHVTHAAVQELAIAPGGQIWVVIKASSCFIAQE